MAGAPARLAANRAGRRAPLRGLPSRPCRTSSLATARAGRAHRSRVGAAAAAMEGQGLRRFQSREQSARDRSAALAMVAHGAVWQSDGRLLRRHASRRGAAPARADVPPGKSTRVHRGPRALCAPHHRMGNRPIGVRRSVGDARRREDPGGHAVLRADARSIAAVGGNRPLGPREPGSRPVCPGLGPRSAAFPGTAPRWSALSGRVFRASVKLN